MVLQLWLWSSLCLCSGTTSSSKSLWRDVGSSNIALKRKSLVTERNNSNASEWHLLLWVGRTGFWFAFSVCLLWIFWLEFFTPMFVELEPCVSLEIKPKTAFSDMSWKVFPSHWICPNSSPEASGISFSSSSDQKQHQQGINTQSYPAEILIHKTKQYSLKACVKVFLILSVSVTNICILQSSIFLGHSFEGVSLQLLWTKLQPWKSCLNLWCLWNTGSQGWGLSGELVCTVLEAPLLKAIGNLLAHPGWSEETFWWTSPFSPAQL